MKSRTLKIGKAAAGLVLALLFLSLTWTSGRAGFSSLLSTYASKSYELEAANAAVNLSSDSPVAHQVRGTILEARQDLRGAEAAYQRAALGRPEDCIYWLSLARVRELNGDAAGAVEAARRAVPLAPFYAQPHWQLGNVLIRAGQTEEAFKELRTATLSDPRLLPGVTDLAWRVSRGDARFVERAVQPKTPAEFRTLGQYLRQLGALDAALYLYNASGGVAPPEERRANVAALILAKRYQEAFDLWKLDRQQIFSGGLVDPGFEDDINLEEAGFGWRTAEKIQGFQLSLDTNNPKEGRASLKVSFEGESLPSDAVMTQLVLVEPNSRYRLSFSARTDAIVSGGLPQVVVTDAGNNYSLAQSVVLSQGTSGWQDYSLEFTPDSLTAIQIRLQRQSCTSPACPIFGRLWLDQMSLRKL